MVSDVANPDTEEIMDLETCLYALAWIAGFVIFLARFGKMYRD